MAASSLQSSFDEHHPPEPKLIDDCVHCGFCLPTCPTYVLWGEEMDSPRGRIYLMKLASEGEVSLNQTVVQHFDRCLGCMACVTACPSGVQYDKLIEATRPQVERNYPRALSERLFRRAIFELFPYPRRLRVLLGPAVLYQMLGLRRLAQRLGLTRLLPAGLRAMEGLLPGLGPEMLRDRLPAFTAAGSAAQKALQGRARVGLIAGCVQRVLFAEVNLATIRVLAAEGCEVVAPPEQGCCGALELHAGYDQRALERARRLIAVFEQVDVETIVVNAAGCGSTLKQYGYLLRDDPDWAERGEAFSAKVRDISEVLAELEPVAAYSPLPYRIAYHDACHLRHAQGVWAQPRQVLGRVPGLELLEIAEPEICCGSAGIYNLLQPAAAGDLGARKAHNIVATGAQAVVTSNPGCLLQIGSTLRQLGRPLPALHPVELLDASIRGVAPPGL